jgi:hypothetical protein
LFVCNWEGSDVEDSAVNDIVLKVQTEFRRLDHAHANKGIDSDIVSNGNFERGGMALFTIMRHVVLDDCQESGHKFSRLNSVAVVIRNDTGKSKRSILLLSPNEALYEVWVLFGDG